MRNKYEIVVLMPNNTFYNKIIEADYITVEKNSGVTVFWFEEYNDHNTVIATAPPTAIVIQYKELIN